ncbi:MAG: MFS transporter [Promethearchaeota archaeon]
MTEYITSKEEPETNLRGYLIFLIGQWVSQFGSNVVGFSIIWFLTVTTGSTFILGLSTFLNFAPFLIATPIAGVFIDRWSRKKVIAFVDFMQAFFTLVLIGFFVMDIFSDLELVAILLALNTVRALFGAFHTSAVDTLLPIMVPKKYYSRMFSVNNFVNGILGGIAGPLIGAILLELFSLKTILWIDVITFLFAIVPTVLVHFPQVLKKDIERKEKNPFRVEFTEGLQFIIGKPGLFALLFVFAGANFFMPPFYIQLPLFVTSIHLGGASHLAFLFAIQQAGTLLGSLVMTIWKGFENHARGVALSMFIAYVGFIIMLSAPIGYFEIIGLGLFIAGFTLPTVNASSEAIWASTVPRELLGRVYAVRRTLAQITAPVTMLLSGIVAEFIGLYTVLTLSALCGLLILGYSWFLTPLPEVEQSIQEPKEEIIEEAQPTLN